MSDDLEFKIAKLELGKDDILVMKFQHTRLSAEHMENIERFVRTKIGGDVRLLVVDREVDLSVVASASK